MSDRLAWLLLRQKGVGSSDAPNLVGVGFQDAAAVYRSKVLAPSAEMPAAGPLARGVALEPLVADRYATEMDCGPLAACDQVAHTGRIWQLANPDRRRVDGRHVELKSVAGFSDDWGRSGTDRIPDGYAVQVQHQMGVLGAESIDLAALDVIGWELRVYRIAFDPTFFGWLSAVEERFWREHVEKLQPPGPAWEDQFREQALAQIVKDKRVELGADAVELIEHRKELGAIRDEADEGYRRITSRLEALMATAERATAGPYTLKRTLIAGGEYTATRRPYTRLDVRPAKKGGA